MQEKARKKLSKNQQIKLAKSTRKSQVTHTTKHAKSSKAVKHDLQRQKLQRHSAKYRYQIDQ